MLADFRFAFRQLRKSPGFTAIAVLTLALAIGVNSAIFAFVNGLILKPVVPVRPAEVVNLYTASRDASHDYRQFSFSELRVLRQNHDVFAGVAGSQFGFVQVGRENSVQRTFAAVTSENFFSLLGTKPALGRFYSAEECRPNANIPVVVASYLFWKRMGGGADFIGSELRVDGRPYTVIGVTREGFNGLTALYGPEIWLPLGVFSQLGSSFGESTALADLEQPKSYALNVVARLLPGLTINSAQPRLPGIAQRLTAIQPPDAKAPRELQIQKLPRFGASPEPSDESRLDLMGVLLVAMAAAVLLIACLNLANMLLARGTARAKEMAIRLALGASRWRVVRQLLCEGLLLALVGGLAGLLVSLWSNDFLLDWIIATYFFIGNFSVGAPLRPDAVVLAVTFVFCLLATLLFSVGPALKATRADLVNDLKQQAGDPARAGQWNRFFAPRHLLVMGQIALSLMLLFSAGLFFRGALKASGLDFGFTARDGIVAEMDFTLGRHDETVARREMFAAVQGARRLPGVRGAALSTLIPTSNTNISMRRVMPAAAKTDPKARDSREMEPFAAITPDYFDAIGVPLLRGRDFTQTEAENKNSPRVAIIDEGMARKLFPNEEALGQRIRYTQAPSDGSPAEMEIVGIVRPHRQWVTRDIPPRVFVPLAQAYSGAVYLYVRLTSANRAVLVSQIDPLRQVLRSIDANLPVLRIVPFTDFAQKDPGLWSERLLAVMFGVFGALALLLAVIGVYGVKAYAVACRTREIGIRMALGADRSDVFALIMKQGALQTICALGVGILLALGTGRVLARLLFQVSPADLITLIAASVLLAAATLLACFFPARRATRVSPMTALRTE